jgi:hypothetical protein
MRLYAENQELMDRLLGLRLVAQLPADDVSSQARLLRMRRALVEERWADAVLEWIEETRRVVDVYDYAPDVYDAGARIWTETELSADRVQRELPSAPLFKRAK